MNNSSSTKENRTLLCIVGPSGSGKTTLAETLEKDGLKQVQSYTTRKPRYEGEKGHIFVSDAEFDALGSLCAYTEFNGHRYGVTQDIIDTSDVYVIDVDGVKFLREQYHGEKDIIVIGLDVKDTETLRQRMKKRGDSDEQIEERIKHDKKAFADLYEVSDYIIPCEGTVDTMKALVQGIMHLEERG